MKDKQHRVTVTYHGIDWTVAGYYQPEQKAVMYKKNGDPGEPGFPSDLIDAEIWIKQDNDESDEMQDILTQKAKDIIISRALEQISESEKERRELGIGDLEDNIPW